MTSMTRILVAGAFLVGLSLGWSIKGEFGALEAQAPGKPFMMQRIYTGADGQSHVENIELNAQSVMEKVAKVSVSVSPPGRFSDYHVAPERRYIVNLTGGGQLRLADGTFDFPPGSIEYIDDLTGKGHTTANVGKEPRVTLILQLEEQKQTIGPIAGRKPR